MMAASSQAKEAGFGKITKTPSNEEIPLHSFVPGCPLPYHHVGSDVDEVSKNRTYLSAI